MALRRRGGASYDTGAQFFTARDPGFASVLEEASAAGVVTRWFGDNEPVWRGVDGMTDLPKWLAEELQTAVGQPGARMTIDLATRVSAIDLVSNTDHPFLFSFDDERPAMRASCAIISAPVPQGLDLLSPELRAVLPERLSSIAYQPCLALLLEIDTPAPEWLGERGIGRFRDRGIDSIVDNRTKGLPQTRTPSISALTVHFSSEISTRLYDSEEADTILSLLSMLSEAIEQTHPEWSKRNEGAHFVREIITATNDNRVQLKKWRYARPIHSAPQPFLRSTDPGLPFYIVGDAFGPARVEGAWLSGVAAAQQVSDRC